jgi:cytochrome P450
MTKIRRAIGAAFAASNLLDYEDCINESIDELVAAFRKEQTVDIVEWLALATMDILSRVAFSESAGFVKNGGDVDNILQSITTRFVWWQFWAAIPGLERLLYRNPVAMRMSHIGGNTLAQMAASKLQARKVGPLQVSQRDLLQKYIEASEKHPDSVNADTIVGMIISTIAAGADTTAVTVATVLYYLIKNPDAQEMLLEELTEARREGNLSDRPTWVQVNKLRYLDAVIKESMRCWPIASFMIDRVVPKGGAMLSGTFIPEGTQVGCNPYPVHRLEEIWGEDVNAFRPGRWLDADEQSRRRMDKAFLGFSMGKRVCIGLHIAELEMKKMISQLLLTFKMDFVNRDQEIGLRRSNNSVRVPGPILVKFENRQ